MCKWERTSASDRLARAAPSIPPQSEARRVTVPIGLAGGGVVGHGAPPSSAVTRAAIEQRLAEAKTKRMQAWQMAVKLLLYLKPDPGIES